MAEERRHKATVKFVERNWIKLQNLAAIQNTSATAILNELVQAYVEDKLPDRYAERIEAEVNRVLDSKIEATLIDAIAEKVREKLIGTGRLIHRDSPDSTDNTVLSEAREDTPTTDNTVYLESVSSTDNTVSTEAPSKTEANLAKFKRYKASDRAKGHKDSYVAEKEGLATYTVSRYRTGKRSPSVEFIERWGLNWNGSEWLDNKPDRAR